MSDDTTYIYDLEPFRLSHRLVIIVANEYPTGITARELADMFYPRAYSTIYTTLQKLVLQGFLSRLEIERLNANHRPTIIYRATTKGKQKTNFLMREQFGDRWIPLPV